MKRLSIFTLTVFLAVSVLLFVSYINPTAEAGPSKNDVTELRVSIHMSPNSTSVIIIKDWAKKLAEVSGGRLKATVYPSETLLSQKDLLTGVKSGVADLALIVMHTYQDQFPLNLILSLPFLFLGDEQTSYRIWMELLEEFPEMKAEFKDFKLAFGGAGQSYGLHTSKAVGPVRVPDDLKNVKLFATGSLMDVMKKIGADPLFLPPTDWYMAADRGVMKGMWMLPDGVYFTKLYEIFTNHTSFPSGVVCSLSTWLMNKDQYNKLPPDLKEAFDSLSPWAVDKFMEGQLASDAASMSKMEKEGRDQNFIMLTPKEEALWKQASLSIHKEYLAKLDARGLPATSIYNEAMRLSELYKTGE